MSTLQSAILAALPQLRAEAEARMVSACVIERVTGLVTAADGTVSESVTLVWSGGCRVRGRGEWVSEQGEGATNAVHSTEVHIPVSALGVMSGDRITITDSPEPRQVGNVYRIVRLHDGSQTTAQRLGVESWAQTLTS